MHGIPRFSATLCGMLTIKAHGCFLVEMSTKRGGARGKPIRNLREVAKAAAPMSFVSAFYWRLLLFFQGGPGHEWKLSPLPSLNGQHKNTNDGEQTTCLLSSWKFAAWYLSLLCTVAGRVDSVGGAGSDHQPSQANLILLLYGPVAFGDGWSWEIIYILYKWD